MRNFFKRLQDWVFRLIVFFRQFLYNHLWWVNDQYLDVVR